jgi:hypothetical protein
VKKTMWIIAATMMLSAIPVSAMQKCPGGVTVPDTMLCPGAPTSDDIDASANARRARDRAQDQAQAQQQYSAAFIQAAEGCKYRAGGGAGTPALKAVPRPDGTVRMLGTATQRFNYETCMEQSGFPLEAK